RGTGPCGRWLRARLPQTRVFIYAGPALVAGRTRIDKDVCLRKGLVLRLLLLDDHRLDGRGDAVLDLDVDHAGADRADRLLEVDLAAIDLDAAGLLDRVDDVLRRDRAEQTAVVARLVRDREHRAAEHGGGVLRALVGLR